MYGQSRTRPQVAIAEWMMSSTSARLVLCQVYLEALLFLIRWGYILALSELDTHM